MEAPQHREGRVGDDASRPVLASTTPFDYQPRTRVIFGAGSVDRVGPLARELGASRVLLVTDAGLVAAGHAVRVERALAAAGLHVTRFDRVRENPSTRCVERCLRAARETAIDTFVALGGGSAIDTARGCNFLFTNGGQMKDYWGVGKAAKPMRPLLAIPTTAGTGSEMQSAALIADAETHQKMACLDPKAAARVAILDPALTLSQPASVTATTGLDAIAHALESAVTKTRNAVSMFFAREAFTLGIGALPVVMKTPQDVEARGRMLLAAALAGSAIETSMLGAAHAAANPITARCGLAHGQAVGLMLPHVMRFNAHEPAARQIYAELAGLAGILPAGGGAQAGADALIGHVERLLIAAECPRFLSQCGVLKDNFSLLAWEASKQWTASFNPRPVTAKDFGALYEAAW